RDRDPPGEPPGDAPLRAKRKSEAAQRAALRTCRSAPRLAAAGMAGLSRCMARTGSERVRRCGARKSIAASTRQRDLLRPPGRLLRAIYGVNWGWMRFSSASKSAH